VRFAGWSRATVPAAPTLEADSFAADVSGETLRVTTLGDKRAGSRVNLEPSLRAGDALGGHWVSGHVDGVAEVVATERDARSLQARIEAPGPLARYIARKGSVTLDGVSLTVNDVDGTRFSINLIPHTLEVTTLGTLARGSRLNLEIDLLARYVERLNAMPA
jgi:riboflavin synthase